MIERSFDIGHLSTNKESMDYEKLLSMKNFNWGPQVVTVFDLLSCSGGVTIEADKYAHACANICTYAFRT